MGSIDYIDLEEALETLEDVLFDGLVLCLRRLARVECCLERFLVLLKVRGLVEDGFESVDLLRINHHAEPLALHVV